jgi:hypothetical protein
MTSNAGTEFVLKFQKSLFFFRGYQAPEILNGEVYVNLMNEIYLS